MWATHTRLAVVCGGVLAAVALPHSCFLLCLAELVLLLRPGDALRKSVEHTIPCDQPEHLQIGAFIGSGPGSLWLRGVRGDGYILSCFPLALFKVVAPRPGL